MHAILLALAIGVPEGRALSEDSRMLVFEGTVELNQWAPDRPVPVAVGVRIDGVRHPLARVETDANGSYRVEVELADDLPALDEQTLYYAHVAAPGYQAYARRCQRSGDGIVSVPPPLPWLAYSLSEFAFPSALGSQFRSGRVRTPRCRG